MCGAVWHRWKHGDHRSQRCDEGGNNDASFVYDRARPCEWDVDRGVRVRREYAGARVDARDSAAKESERVALSGREAQEFAYGPCVLYRRCPRSMRLPGSARVSSRGEVREVL